MSSGDVDRTPKRARVTNWPGHTHATEMLDMDEANASQPAPEPGSRKRPLTAREPRKREGFCALLADLPQGGAFSRLCREDVEESSKRPVYVPRLQPTYDTVGPRCRRVKSDETNILVRAMRVKKRKERERRRLLKADKQRALEQDKRDAERKQVGRKGTKRGLEADEADEHALATPVSKRRGRSSASTSPGIVADTPVPRAAGGAAAAAADGESRETVPETPGQAAPKEADAGGDDGGRDGSCSCSPRPGSSRVRTPPPPPGSRQSSPEVPTLSSPPTLATQDGSATAQDRGAESAA